MTRSLSKLRDRTTRAGRAATRALPTALSYLLLTLLLGGCSSIMGNRYVAGLRTGDFGSGRITQEELREALIQYASRFEATVVATANTISAGTKDPLIQRRTLRWKLELTPVVNQAAFAGEPESAYVAVLTIATSMNDYLTTGAGVDVFGEQQTLAVNASAELLAAAIELGDRFLDDKELAHVTSDVRTLVREQPIRGEFIAEKIQTLVTASEASPIFDWVTAIPLSPFRALQGVDQGAQAIREFNDTAAEMSRLLASMPRLVRWNLELLALDVTEQGNIESTLESFDTLARSAESLSQTTASLPVEPARAARGSGAHRPGAGTAFGIARAHRHRGCGGRHRVGWAGCRARQAAGGSDNAVASVRHPRVGADGCADHLGCHRAARAARVRSTLAGSSTLAGPLADLTARVERVEAGSRALVDLAALRVLQLIFAFFVLLFVYRRIESRLGPPGRSRPGAARGTVVGASSRTWTGSGSKAQCRCSRRVCARPHPTRPTAPIATDAYNTIETQNEIGSSARSTGRRCDATLLARTVSPVVTPV